MITNISHLSDFNQAVDDTDPFNCTVEQIDDLIDEAPDAHSRGWLAGVRAAREFIDLSLQLLPPAQQVPAQAGDGGA